MFSAEIQDIRKQLEGLAGAGSETANAILGDAAPFFAGDRPSAKMLLLLLPATFDLPSPTGEALRELALATMSSADWDGCSAAADIQVLPSPLHSSGAMTVVMQGGSSIESVGGLSPDASELPPLLVMEPDENDIGGRLMISELLRKTTCTVIPRHEAEAYIRGEGRWWRLCTLGTPGVMLFSLCRKLGLTPRFDTTKRYMRGMTAMMSRDHVDALDFAVPGWRALSAYGEG